MLIRIEKAPNTQLLQLIINTSEQFNNSVEAYANQLPTNQKTNEAALLSLGNLVISLTTFGLQNYRDIQLEESETAIQLENILTLTLTILDTIQPTHQQH